MSQNLKAITVYLGSSGHARPVFYEQARQLGKKIAEAGIELIFGGMNAGSMRTLSHGVMEHGGKVTGVIPTKIRDSERVYHDIDKLIDVESMWERKKLMFDLGDALIMLPGGYGTLDEGLEAVYWKALALHQKEIIFIDVEGYWTPLFRFIEASIARGAMEENIKDLYRVVENVGEIDFSSLSPPRASRSNPVPNASDSGLPRCARGDAEKFPHFEDEIFTDTRLPLIFDTADLMSIYKMMTALVTKQLSAHDRSIGVLNKGGQFDDLLDWIKVAAEERFITRECPKLLITRKTEKGLLDALERSEHVVIDLHREKWGD